MEETILDTIDFVYTRSRFPSFSTHKLEVCTNCGGIKVLFDNKILMINNNEYTLKHDS